MNKQDFTELMAKESKMSKVKAQEAINTFLDILANEILKGEKVTFIGFGTFQSCKQASRIARNPKTGEPVTIEERNIVKFKAGKNLLDRVNMK